MSAPRCPFRPELTLVQPQRRRGAALGWAASAAVVALGLSGLAALAMAVAPGGEAGDEMLAVPILLPPPAPALGALSEAAPETAPAAPKAAEAPPEDVPPDLPQTAEAPPERPHPDRPDAAAAEAAPSPDTAAPPPLPPPPPPPAALAEAEVKPEPKPEPKPEIKPRPQARPDPKPAPAKKAAQPAEPPKDKAAAPAKDRSHAAAAAAPTQKPSAKSAGSGKAAAASYGAEVMKKIRKTKKKKAAGKGTAVVGFSVGASGALVSAKIIRSSGLPALDALALDHIRRAAPFPPPPPGAETRFSFEFVGK